MCVALHGYTPVVSPPLPSNTLPFASASSQQTSSGSILLELDEMLQSQPKMQRSCSEPHQLSSLGSFSISDRILLRVESHTSSRTDDYLDY